MDLHDRAMLDFTKAWHPYGGADEQIFPEFGISAQVFYRRALSLLSRKLTGPELGETERTSLQTFCEAKLSQYGISVANGWSGRHGLAVGDRVNAAPRSGGRGRCDSSGNRETDCRVGTLSAFSVKSDAFDWES